MPKVPALAKEVAKQMKEQWTLPPIDTPIAVHISCAGAARGDVDNYMGAIFDTGNKIIWSDDRANIIQSASIDFTKRRIESYIQIRISDIGSKEARIDCIDRVMDQ